MTSETDVKNALQTTRDKFGRLDVTVNCAGIASASRVYNFKKDQPYNLKDFQKTIEVILFYQICMNFMYKASALTSVNVCNSFIIKLNLESDQILFENLVGPVFCSVGGA